MLVKHIEDRWGDLLQVNGKPTEKLGHVSPLVPYASKNLWLTTSYLKFRMHFRSGVVQSLGFSDWRMIHDGDLKDSAWHDTDKSEKTLDPMTLTGEPTLLIVILGSTKRATVSELLMDAVRRRIHKKKYTWLIDAPSAPFQDGHPAWSPLLGGIVETWERVQIGQAVAPVKAVWRPSLLPDEPPERVVLQSGEIDPDGDVTDVEGEPDAN
jgi:hypothetical protein